MPITVELIKDGRALLQTYSNPINAIQMEDLRHKMDSEILPSSAGKLHIIADFRAVSDLPRTILMTSRNWVKKAHPNTGTIIFVVNGGFVQSMAEIFSRLSSKQAFIVATSMENGLAQLDTLLGIKEVS